MSLHEPDEKGACERDGHHAGTALHHLLPSRQLMTGFARGAEKRGGKKHCEQLGCLCEKGVGWCSQWGFDYQLAKLPEEERKHCFRDLLLVRRDNVELPYYVFLLDPLHHEPCHYPQDEDGVVGLPDEETVFSEHRIFQLRGAQQNNLLRQNQHQLQRQCVDSNL